MTKTCGVVAWLDWPTVVQIFDSDTAEECDYVLQRTCQIEEVCCCTKGNGRTCDGECIDSQPCWSENICTACGERVEGKPNYCPNCGAKAVG